MDIFYSLHAQRTMTARGVTREEIEAVISRPAVTYRGNHENAEAKVYQGSDLGVVVVPEYGGLLVITILWRRVENWTTGEMKDSR